MEKKDDEIEDLFKDSFETFEPEVKPKVWDNVRAAIKWGSVGLFIKMLISKIGTNTIVAFVSSALTIASTVFVMNNKSKSETPIPEIKESKETEIPVTTITDTIYKIVEKEVPVPTAAKAIPAPAKSTSIPNGKGEQKKVESFINSILDREVATIYASPISGAVPLIVNLKNLGEAQSNTWSFSDGKNSTNANNPVHIFERPGEYVVTLKSVGKEGRVAIDKVTIKVTGNSSLSYPQKTFSPNGDGVADEFSFKSNNMTNMSVKIYDVKGKLVYNWEGTDGVWNGTTSDGSKAKKGKYVYSIVAEGVDGKQYNHAGVLKLDR